MFGENGKVAVMLNKEIRTDRLLLRPVRIEDAVKLESLQTWDVRRWLASVPWPRTTEDLKAYIRKAEEDNRAGLSAHYVIILDGEPCGMIALHPRDGAYSLGYWLGERYWGQGIMVEAAEAFVDAFFEQTNAFHITSGAFVDNEASSRVQKRLGFATVGETLRYARPAGKMMPYYETVLGRKRRCARFAA